MRRIALILVVLSIVTAQTAPAQAPRAFEVASIKPNDRTSGLRFSFPPGGAFSASLPVDWLIAVAYDLPRPDRIVGAPDWAKTRFFDVEAKPASPATRAETLAMLRTLLDDRFGLVVRRDPNGKATVWVLTMAREDKRLGPSIRPAAIECVKTPAPAPLSERQLRPGLPVPCGSLGAGDVEAGGSMPISQLASAIRRKLLVEVVDRTGLTGNFDYYVPLPRPPRDFVSPDGQASIFTIVQEQLGMKLQLEEITRDVFVVERVSPPTPN